MYYQLCINSYYLTDTDKLICSETYQNVPAKVGIILLEDKFSQQIKLLNDQ